MLKSGLCFRIGSDVIVVELTSEVQPCKTLGALGYMWVMKRLGGLLSYCVIDVVGMLECYVKGSCRRVILLNLWNVIRICL